MTKPRWIRIKAEAVPFDYPWPGRTAYTAFTAPGAYLVKAEVADFAVAKGYALEGKGGSQARSRKGKMPKAAKSAKASSHAAPDTGSNNSLDGGDLVADDRAGAGQPVDQASR